MLVIKIDGQTHYINMGHVIEIYESEEPYLTLNIRLVDGKILTISNKEEQEDLRNFLEVGAERGEA